MSGGWRPSCSLLAQPRTLVQSSVLQEGTCFSNCTLSPYRLLGPSSHMWLVPSVQKLCLFLSSPGYLLIPRYHLSLHPVLCLRVLRSIYNIAFVPLVLCLMAISLVDFKLCEGRDCAFKVLHCNINTYTLSGTTVSTPLLSLPSPVTAPVQAMLYLLWATLVASWQVCHPPTLAAQTGLSKIYIYLYPSSV